jgi:hypothetical protein
MKTYEERREQEKPQDQPISVYDLSDLQVRFVLDSLLGKMGYEVIRQRRTGNVTLNELLGYDAVKAECRDDF